MRPLLLVLTLLISSSLIGKGNWDEKKTSEFLRVHGYSSVHQTEIALIIPYKSCVGNSSMIFDFLKEYSGSPIYSVLLGTTEQEVSVDPLFRDVRFNKVLGKQLAAETAPGQANTVKIAYIYNSEVKLVEPMDCHNFEAQSQKMKAFLSYGQQLVSQR